MTVHRGSSSRGAGPSLSSAAAPATAQQSRSNPSAPAPRTARRRAPGPAHLASPWTKPGRTRGGRERRSSKRRRESSATPGDRRAPRSTSPSASARPSSQVGPDHDLRQLRRRIRRRCSGRRRSTTSSRAPKPDGAASPSSCRPSTSRSRSRSRCAPRVDYGLRFTVSEHHPDDAAGRRRPTFWGFPGRRKHDAERFPKGSPGAPAGCAGRRRHELPRRARRASAIPSSPLTDNPSDLHRRRRCRRRSTVQTYQDPTDLRPRRVSYPETTGCESSASTPSSTSA